MPVNIQADPGQVDIPNDIGIGGAQVLKQPDLSYLDRQNELEDRERFAFKQQQRAQLKSEQDKIAAQLNVEGKGKIFQADDPYIMDKTQKLTKWLYDDGNATKVAQGNPQARMQWNNMSRDYTLAINDSVNKNLAYTAQQKIIDHDGGYKGYYPDAQKHMEELLKPLTPEQIANGEKPPQIDENRIQAFPKDADTQKEIHQLLGTPHAAGETVSDGAGGFNKTLTTGFTPEEIKEAAATVLQDPRKLNYEAYKLDQVWDSLTPEEQKKYTKPDADGNMTEKDVMKYAEDRFAKSMSRITSIQTHQQPNAALTKQQNSAPGDATPEKEPILNDKGEKMDDWERKSYTTTPVPVKGLHIIPSYLNAGTNRLISNDGKNESIDGQIGSIDVGPVQRGSLIPLSPSQIAALYKEGKGDQVDVAAMGVITGDTKTDEPDPAKFQALMKAWQKDKKKFDDKTAADQEADPLRPMPTLATTPTKEGKYLNGVKVPLVDLKQALGAKNIDYNDYSQKAKDYKAELDAKYGGTKQFANKSTGIKVGHVENGFVYQGGDPSLPKNWKAQ